MPQLKLRGHEAGRHPPHGNAAPQAQRARSRATPTARQCRTSSSEEQKPGDIHRIANPFDEPVHIIEVQCGDYLGEDDIVRLDDNYGRQGTNT